MGRHVASSGLGKWPPHPRSLGPGGRVRVHLPRSSVFALQSSTLLYCAAFLPHRALDVLYLVLQLPADLRLLPAGYFPPLVELLLPLFHSMLLRLLVGMSPRLSFALLLRELFLILPSFDFPARPLCCLLLLLLPQLLSGRPQLPVELPLVVLRNVKRPLCRCLRSEQATNQGDDD